MSGYVMGIDSSLTRTGITVLTQDRNGVARPKVLKDCGYSLPDTAGFDESADRIVSQARTVARVLDKFPPALVLIEAMIPPKNALPSYLERGALWYSLWYEFRARNIPRALIQPTTLKAWATGYGRAEKEDILGEVSKWWPAIPVANHDIADSAVCAAMCAMRLGWKLPFETRRRHIEGVVTVRWPDELAPFTLRPAPVERRRKAGIR
ncbi:crossover junction endodeoxyribonuclease RuvC [Mycolicibacterium goodii]|uniref:crossover junction endodeoxyribonuclease RuvC n=1 Tax=Mycolicibacterium goodii TaxID=134601 RepID=UPI001BDDBA02|nr:crossover junction endodeoxyribonuclease RuvC [Mycolicibacterium goodii]MBU8834455.1 crossover junction endodeoxyribonuclease RuvC [Mycolicibacterium goodii]